MRNDPTIFVLLGAALLIALAVALHSSRRANRQAEEELKRTRARLTETRTALETATAKEAETQRAKNNLEIILKETAKFYPSLAVALADFHALEGERIATYLTKKSNPGYKSADAVRDANRAKRNAEERLHVTRYQLAYYETAFPWLVELSGRTTEELLPELEVRIKQESAQSDDGSSQDDAVRKWLSESEWKRLSSAARSDLALERWQKSAKSNWQIGREYERSIGYKYELDGFRVEYIGAIKGFEDMGRDLIAKKGGITHLVQCKYWRQERIIHEKHVFQLIGTALEYACTNAAQQVSHLDLQDMGIVPVLVTSTQLSETARRCAALTNVVVREQQAFAPYPVIKCNIGRSGDKIYHLPFDQQYDTTRIDAARGECYASTAKEAEKRGFRRAMRHVGGRA